MAHTVRRRHDTDLLQSRLIRLRADHDRRPGARTFGYSGPQQPQKTPYKSAYVLVQAIKQYLPAGQELYQYDMCLYGVDFYGKIRTPIVDDIGEVRYGSEFLPTAEQKHYFLNSEEFFTLVRQRPITYCATKDQERVERLRKVFPNLTIIWDNKEYYLVKLQS